jgi:ABC-type uncharacterized transport system permease subunit
LNCSCINGKKIHGIIAVAIFFGILEYGGLTINTMLPKEIITILQGLIIIFVIITSKILDRNYQSLKLLL